MILLLLLLLAVPASTLEECSLRCENGGTCELKSGIEMCSCPPEWGGYNCEQKLDYKPGECIKDSCNLFQLCVYEEGYGHRCDCAPGRYGKECVMDCDCENGGRCSAEGWNATEEAPCLCPRGFMGTLCQEAIPEMCSCSEGAMQCRIIGGYENCKCRVGYSGPSCEFRDGCSPGICKNNGTCGTTASELFYRCNCPQGYIGAFCEVGPGDRKAIEIARKEERSNSEGCKVDACKLLANNGKCDEECNHAPCGFDGGECSAGVEPFEKCPTPNHCLDSFMNGICDWECNTEECLFDGYDCKAHPDCRRGDCAHKYADGVCDLECNTTECSQDGGDCSIESKILDEGLAIGIVGDPTTFMSQSTALLQGMSRKLRMALRPKKDQEGRPLIFYWDLKNGRGERFEEEEGRSSWRRQKRVAAPQRGVEMHLQLVDVVNCSQDLECIRSASIAREFLGAVEVKQGNRTKRDAPPYKVRLITVTFPHSKNFFAQPWLLVLLALVALSVSIVVVVSGTRTMRAPVWMPPKDEADVAVPASPLAKEPPLPAFSPSLLHRQAHGNIPITSPVNRAHVNKVDAEGRTPLFWLVANLQKDTELIKSEISLLAALGADLNHQDEAGETALFAAVASCRLSLARRLLQLGADPTRAKKNGETPLHRAVRTDDVKSVHWLLEQPVVCSKVNEVDVEDRSALALCAFSNSLEIAEMLIAVGADINYAGNELTPWIYRGRTPLHWAAFMENLPLVEMLLSRGANVDEMDYERWTPLMLAVHRGAIHVCRLLLQSKASTNLTNSAGHNAVDLACFRGCPKMIELLMDYYEPVHLELRPEKRRRKCTKTATLNKTIPAKRNCNAATSPSSISLYTSDSASHTSSTTSWSSMSSPHSETSTGSTVNRFQMLSMDAFKSESWPPKDASIYSRESLASPDSAYAESLGCSTPTAFFDGSLQSLNDDLFHARQNYKFVPSPPQPSDFWETVNEEITVYPSYGN